jgi:hypothetical protein
MIGLTFSFLFAFLTPYAFACAAESFDLQGFWIRSNARQFERPIQFIRIGTTFRAQTQERFYFENGRLSHTIDQLVKIQMSEGLELHGTVDFFDSRGCSFKNNNLLVDIQNNQTINVLMTVPRYIYQKFTNSPNNNWERPTLIRTDCRILEFVEVAAQLYRQ